jgi:hypothetical protein
MPDPFNPLVDGWKFHNFKKMDATWDLYRDTYLGINPTENCAEALLDCLFYEQGFKIVADKGHCAGISLLGLAIYKYGSYMGFCSPASIYEGDANGPDRADLKRALGILHARTFSLGGIENFLDAFDNRNLNNAVAAYERIEAGLASGDYAMLSIANGPDPDGIVHSGHALIPYECHKSGSTRVIRLWDPNFPADDFPMHYGTVRDQLIIKSEDGTDWEYLGALGKSTPYPYLGKNKGWCFAIPMSRVLSKDRQPASLGRDAVVSVFLRGLGATISQISDEQGHTLYSTNASRREFEPDPDRRLKGVMPWPSLGQAKGASVPGEIYVMRGGEGRSPLTFTVSGAEYKFTHFQGRSMTVVDGSSSKRMKDLIRISTTSHDLHRTVEVSSSGQRELTLQAIHVHDDERGAWKSAELRKVKLANSTLRMQIIGALDDVHVDGLRKKVQFDLKMQERRNKKIRSKQYKNVSATASQPFRMSKEKKAKR